MALADTPALNAVKLMEECGRPPQAAASPLVPLKQTPRVHLVRHVCELVAPAVGDDHVAAGLEGLQVVGHLGAEELRRVQRGLVDHHGHAFGLHALHNALDGARAEVIAVGVHRYAMNTLTIGFSLSQHRHKLLGTLNKYYVEACSRKGKPRFKLLGTYTVLHSTGLRCP